MRAALDEEFGLPDNSLPDHGQCNDRQAAESQPRIMVWCTVLREQAHAHHRQTDPGLSTFDAPSLFTVDHS